MELKDLDHLLSLRQAYETNVEEYKKSRRITGFHVYYVHGHQSRHFHCREPEGRLLRDTFIKSAYNRVIESARVLSAAGVTVVVGPIDLEPDGE